LFAEPARRGKRKGLGICRKTGGEEVEMTKEWADRRRFSLGGFMLLAVFLAVMCPGPGWGEESKPHHTPFSMDFYGTIAGAKAGDRVTVYNPRGILCGEFTLDRDGRYGFLPVYGDDTATVEEDGARRGDVLTFHLNGVPLSSATPIIWRGDRERQRVDFP